MIKTKEVLTPENCHRRGLRNAVLPPKQWIFDNLIPAEIVASIVAPGNVGKSFLALQLLSSLASGRPFGIFYPNNAMKVLYLSGEDSSSVVNERLQAIISEYTKEEVEVWEKNFFTHSVIGSVQLVSISEGNFKTGAEFQWLVESISRFEGLGCIVIDPKVNFYCLDENSNDQCNYWIGVLREIIELYHLTIIVIHHENKSKDSSGRGASAFKDGCRWAAQLQELDPNTAAKYGIEDYKNYILLNHTKSSQSKRLSQPIYFKRGEGGVLIPVDLRDVAKSLATELLREILFDSSHEHTLEGITGIIKDSMGSSVYNEMKDTFKALKQEHMIKPLEHGKELGYWYFVRYGDKQVIKLCKKGEGK